MTKKMLLISLMLCLIMSSAALLFAQKTVVGGHVKMTLIDYKSGESDGEKGSESAGLAMREFDIIISQDITDNISVVSLTEFAARTSATPSFGRSLEGKRAHPDDIDMLFRGFRVPGNSKSSQGL